MNGNNIIVYRDGVAIAGTKSDEIQSSIDVIQKASESDGQWEHFVGGRKSWALTVGWLILQNEDMQALLTVGTSYTLLIRGREAEDSTGVSGSAILKICKITATRGNLVTGSFQFVGDGPLS